MEVLLGIHLADKGYSNVYLLAKNDKLILIDTGMDKKAVKVINYIKSLGYEPKDVSYILLTHSHLDHVNGLAKIKELSDAKVAIHASEADNLSGEKPLIFPKGIIGTVFKLFSPFIGYKGVKPDILLKGDERIEGLQVIHAPGHTPGSVCFYLEDKKTLFSGDIINYKDGKFEYVNKKYTLDENLLKTSLKKVSEIDFEAMLPGHGDFIKSNASELLREFVKSEGI